MGHSLHLSNLSIYCYFYMHENSRYNDVNEFWRNGNRVYDGREVPEVDLMMGLNGPVKERYNNMIDHSG